jgi:hypothetical protein
LNGDASDYKIILKSFKQCQASKHFGQIKHLPTKKIVYPKLRFCQPCFDDWEQENIRSSGKTLIFLIVFKK